MTERRLRLLVGLVAAAVVAIPAHATFYRWVDSKGTLIYSDAPPPGAPPLPGTTPVAPAPAPEQPPPVSVVEAVTIDHLIGLTGLDRRFKPMAALLAEQLERELNLLRPEDRATALRAANAALTSEALRQAVRADLAAQSHPGNMAAVAEWYRGPIARRRAAAAAVLATPAGGKALSAFAERLRSAPPTSARLGLIEQLDWAEGATDEAVAVRLASSRVMRLTTNSLLPAPRRQRLSAIERDLEVMRAEFESDVQEQVTTTLLFVSRELSDAELEQMLVFSRTLPARWFDAAVKQAVLRTVRAAAERATSDAAQAVPVDRWDAPVAVATKTR